MTHEQFKDTLHDWHSELCDCERNSGVHTSQREATVIKSFDVELGAMLAYVEELRRLAADAQDRLEDMVRQECYDYALDDGTLAYRDNALSAHEDAIAFLVKIGRMAPVLNHRYIFVERATMEQNK